MENYWGYLRVIGNNVKNYIRGIKNGIKKF